MSFYSSQVYAMDKESDLFGQGFSDPCNDFFDQYLTFDTIDNDPSTFTISPHSTDLVKSHSLSGSAGTSSSARDEEAREGILRFSPDEVWDFDQNAASPQNTTSPHHKITPARDNNFYSEDSGRAAISDSELLSLEGIDIESPRACPLSPSLPSSPTKTPAGSLRRTKRFIRSISRGFAQPPVPPIPRDSDCRQRSPIRKATSPAKMMRASQYSEQNLQEWSERLAADAVKFDFGFSQPSRPLSPPPSARVSDASDTSSGMMGMEHHSGGAFSWDHPVAQYATRPMNLHTPQTTPISDGHDFRNQNVQHVSANNMGFPPHQQQSAPSWAPPISAEYNNFGPQTPYVDENESTPAWWNHATTTPISHPSPTSFHRNPQQDTKSLAMQLQSELAYNANELALSPSSLPSGLMIQMPQSPSHHQQSFVVASSPLAHHPQNSAGGYFANAPQPTTPQHHVSGPRHRYTQSQPIPAARQFQSPSIRKSRSRGDLSGTDSPSPPSPRTPLTPRSASFHVAKRRSASRKHSEHQHPPLPKAAMAGNGIDFVNFTPHDSRKILTGVAPSGSSKTKARREKEAMEKRRRLSQAAVRAVQAAGGSIESLVEEGLFV